MKLEPKEASRRAEQAQCDLKAALRAVIEDYDDTGCEGCGFISEEVVSALKSALERSELGSSDPVRQAAERVVSDYDTVGCEGCGSIPAETLYAAKQALVRAER